MSRGNSTGRGAHVMGISAERKPAEEKKVHFPSPKRFDPEEAWKFPCLVGPECTEKQLCRLCFRHLAIRNCWAEGKLPKCPIKGCGGQHSHLLHDALIQGRALVVQEEGSDSSQSYLCREDIRAEVAGRTHHLHTLYDWGATQTLITHDAAYRAGLHLYVIQQDWCRDWAASA